MERHMNIEWEFQWFGDKITTVGKIYLPSNLRHSIVVMYQKDEKGLYRTAFIPAIRAHFDIPTQGLHTETGARRRIRKYLTLWAIAGYPTGSK